MTTADRTPPAPRDYPRVGDTYDLTGFTVSTATLDEWSIVNDWGNREGWNVGFQDAACFLPTDPDGFFLGRLHGEPVGAVSVVNYSDDYAFMGHYLVPREHRGKGYGLGTCEVGGPHSGRRTVGCDGMPNQVENYSKSGFVAAHDTINFVGPLAGPGTASPRAVRLTEQDIDAVAACDRPSFPAPRAGFLRRWLTAEGHRGYGVVEDGGLRGYGVIRPAPAGWRIGPLVADTGAVAEELLESLTSHLDSGVELSVFAPGTTATVPGLFSSRGLTEQFRVVRMYRGPLAEVRMDRVYAIGSLELG